MPYAYGATIKHVFDTDHLNIYLTFRHQMLQSSDYTAVPVVYDVFPPLAKWLIEADAVAVDTVDNEWIDEYTLLITSDTVATRPAQVTVEYDGPDDGLCFRWGKQIEPFGPVFSYDQNWYENPSYVDRGDPDGYDFTKADLTCDSTWRDLSLAAIVPTGVKVVLLRVFIRDTVVSRIIAFRKNGNINDYNSDALYVEVVGVYNRSSIIVSCDTERTIEYYSNLGALGVCLITVGGWWV